MTAELAAVPRLAAGTELLGEFKDSGYSQPPSLVRRADGQVIQMSRLLYLVASRIDGTRGPSAIADLVSRDLGRVLSGDQVRYLISAKLMPLGLIAGRGTPVTLPTASPLLALRAQGTLLPERAANAAGLLLRPLFHWPVIAVVIASVAALDYWLLSAHGLAAGLGQVLRNPVDLLIMAGLSLVSATFHECGHVAGCRYGGARSGRIGIGVYLVWPSFFTNVTDSYRLSRRGRLRTDLGGLYFNLIFILALAGAYAATSAEILPLVIALTHLEMLEQLLPFVRFDGYFILSDIVGVPDLFARVAPVVRSGPARDSQDPRVASLRPRARAVITGWVLGRLPGAATAADQPGPLAFREPPGAPDGHGTHRSSFRASRRQRDQHRPGGAVDRRLAVHRGRARAPGRCPGRALVGRPHRPRAAGRYHGHRLRRRAGALLAHPGAVRGVVARPMPRAPPVAIPTVAITPPSHCRSGPRGTKAYHHPRSSGITKAGLPLLSGPGGARSWSG